MKNNPLDLLAHQNVEMVHGCITMFNEIKPTKRHYKKSGARARLIINRATRMGKKTYSTGEACVNGHYSHRYLSNKNCVECTRIQNKERYANRESKHNGQVAV